MSNYVYKSKEDIERDIKFYKSLGLSETQSKHLATHVLNIKYTSNIKKLNRPSVDDIIGGIGGLAGGLIGGIPFRGVNSRSGGMGSPGMGGMGSAGMGSPGMGGMISPKMGSVSYSAPSRVKCMDVSHSSVHEHEYADECEATFRDCALDFLESPIVYEDSNAVSLDSLEEEYESYDEEDTEEYESDACIEEEDEDDDIDDAEPDIFAVTGRDESGSRHNRIEREADFRDAEVSPTSTFRSTVNTASFTYIKQHMKNLGSIDKKVVRAEEVLNYFDYDFKDKINAELCEDNGRKYMLVGIRGEKVEHKGQNLVILLDTSGSMGSNTDIMQKSIMAMVTQLKPEDRLSLITYSSNDKVLINNAKVNIGDIILKLGDIDIRGCTNGSGGLKKAYEIIEENFIKDGSNRIVIITDGDFNFGIYSEKGLEGFITEKKETGAFLSVIGVGNIYDEKKMEVIARNGNGNYFRLLDDFDVLETLKRRFNANTVVAAKDVKMQVEFNPAVVDQYKLLGYESRELHHEDFNNDKVISETIGSEQVTVALYELKLHDKSQKKKDKEKALKYQKVKDTGSDDICTVALRYKLLDEDKSTRFEYEVKGDFGELTDNTKIAIAVRIFMNLIRDNKCSNVDDLKRAMKMIKNIEEPKVQKLYEIMGKI